MNKKICYLVLAFFLAFSVGLTTAQAKTYKIKFGHPGSAEATGTWTVGSEYFKHYVESQSKGRLEVEIFPNGVLGDMRTLLEMVQMGMLEMCFLTLNGQSFYMPEIQVVDIPYIMKNDAEAEYVADSPFMKEMCLELLKRSGTIRTLAVGNLGRWRAFFTTKKEIKNAADLKGLKIRTIPDALQVEITEAIGANPTPLPWPEVYTALATGVIDGLKLELYLIHLYKFDEIIKFGIADNHSYMWSTMSANDPWLQSLPKDLRELVIEGTRQAINVVTQYAKVCELGALAPFEAMGGKLYVPTKEEMATFEVATPKIIEWYKKNVPNGEMWFNKFQKTLDEGRAFLEERKKLVMTNKESL